WVRRYVEIEMYLVGVASRLQPGPVTVQVLQGMDPAIEINQAVSEMGDDALLVMSGHGRSGIKRLVLGSKTSRLVQLASYPLVVVPAACKEVPESVKRILLALDGSTFAEYALEVALDLF